MNAKNSYQNLDYENLPNIKKFTACDITQKFNPTGIKEPMIDFVFPEIPFPPKYFYEELGEEKIRELVFYHHNLMRKSAIGHLFTHEEDKFKIVLDRTADFFLEALGGGEKYSSKYGHPHLRARHFPFTIDEKAREIWLMFFKKALKDLDVPKKYIKAFWEWLEPMSLRMINRRTMMELPKRYPFEAIANEFGLGENNEK
ncbi:globin [Halarcobacter ebronensis]|uniref:Globin n=1 Tax=Halarcobacter ebronensis TaxID=1462615 RepID=A0A4Q1AM82_9BACT|nr:globin [Halarcobacter ebronensis]QKF82762.1 truncated hemoglobin, group 2 [Halarcobacter ebronensis]RXK06787.1 globin [Halarcobacter ebronensis]